MVNNQGETNMATTNTNSTLAAIRARLAQAEQNKGGNYDNNVFPFWDAKPDTQSTLRFLPDGDSTNTYFWVEKLTIKLPFLGIKGGDTKPVYVSVPCVEMFNDKVAYPHGCPILSEVRAWYKDEALKENAGKYWKKPTYIMQGFVRENAVLDDKAPENPIRRFTLNKQLFNLVKAGLMDEDMINLPTDYEHGTDFRILKTQKSGPNQYADYGTSSYARRETPLTKIELDAIEKYGLSNLSDFLGKKPTPEDIKIIREMFEASVDGEAYDVERWGNYYRPAGFKTEKEEGSESTSNVKAETKVETKTDSATSNSTEAAKPTTNANDILAMIKARGKNKEKA